MEKNKRVTALCVAAAAPAVWAIFAWATFKLDIKCQNKHHQNAIVKWCNQTFSHSVITHCEASKTFKWHTYNWVNYYCTGDKMWGEKRIIQICCDRTNKFWGASTVAMSWLLEVENLNSNTNCVVWISSRHTRWHGQNHDKYIHIKAKIKSRVNWRSPQ